MPSQDHFLENHRENCSHARKNGDTANATFALTLVDRRNLCKEKMAAEYGVEIQN